MRRIGRFEVSNKLGGRPEIRAILDRCDVIEKKDNPPYDRTEYIAYSPDFEPADMAGEPPRYNWIVRTRPDGTFTVEARRYIPDPELQARIARMWQGIFD